MVEKEGTGSEKGALKAYKAAREESENATEVTEGNEVSSALIDRVRIFNPEFVFLSCLSVPSMRFIGRCSMIPTGVYCLYKVDAMLQNLEKEIDDVDAKIGDRWRVLDRFVIVYGFCFLLSFFSTCKIMMNLMWYLPNLFFHIVSAVR